MTYLRSLLRALVAALVYLFTLGWLRQLFELIRDLFRTLRRSKGLEDDRRGRDPRCSPQCATVPPDVYKRPDPLIYSQEFLLEQGLGVTWDNPDIQLFEGGTPVPSHALEADTEYEVRATVWNGSTAAPAVGMRVDFTYHDFGIGPVPVAIGSDVITLPVKGAPGHPATARTTWRTPATPGHYCMKVKLNWADDSNPRNNLGQENTDVGVASSPATFRFPVRNAAEIRRTLRLVADSYEIPPPRRCDDKPGRGRDKPVMTHVPPRGAAPPAAVERARARHARENHPVPPGWTVAIEPSALDLDAGEQRDVTVTVTPPDDFTGEQTVNVNALHGTDLVGGVTLRVRSEGGR